MNAPVRFCSRVNATELHIDDSANRSQSHNNSTKRGADSARLTGLLTAEIRPVKSVVRADGHQIAERPSPQGTRSDGPREKATDATRSVAAASPLWSLTRRRCIGCGVEAVGVVWGLVVCVRCGERINAVAPRGTCLGLGYVVAVCAFVQGLRERPSVPVRGVA